METRPSDSRTEDVLGALRALAQARRARGDQRLLLSPIPQAQEYHDIPDQHDVAPAAVVLEPACGGEFTIQPLARRRRHVAIGAYCDGSRSTYYLGVEGTYPLLYTENWAVVRRRDDVTGYHDSYYGIRRNQATLLAPFGLFEPTVLQPYKRLGLYTIRQADLCRVGGDDDYGLTPVQRQGFGNLAWQNRGQRRARWLMERSEERAALAAAHILRNEHSDGNRWLLKDGSLFQFEKRYLRQAEPLRQVVALVKSHPVPFFGVEGEGKLARMAVGDRSVAFMPRPPSVAKKAPTQQTPLEALASSERPLVSWYLRVREPQLTRADCYSGVVRLDIAAIPGWRDWIDTVSWAVLDEFYGLSALPDRRYDVLAYGVHECEEAIHALRLPGDLLLAGLAD